MTSIKSRAKALAQSMANRFGYEIRKLDTDSMIPPDRLVRLVGGGDFKAIGNEFFDYFVRLGGLRPTERVLDVGCGVGRMAVPLTQYLKPPGGYEGFDIEPESIRWCQTHISRRYRHFRFQQVDLFNKSYNPTGKLLASEHRFPYSSHTFDFVYLTSVFTHMLPKDMEHYLGEIARVLKTGGRCLISFFLLNSESMSLLDEGKSTLAFAPSEDGYWTIDTNIPESAVAYDEHRIRELFQSLGLVIADPIKYGSWPGRKTFLSYQDIIMAAKAEEAQTLWASDSQDIKFTAHNIRLDNGIFTKPDVGHSMDKYPWFVSARRVIEAVFPADKSRFRLVDLGCLEGGYATEFARMGLQVLGLEVRDSNIAACRYVKANVDLPNLEFVQDNAWNVAKYGTFDIVFCCGLFYHLDRPKEFLRVLSSVTTKLLILQTHFSTETPIDAHNLSVSTMNESLMGRWQTEFASDAEFRDREQSRWASWDNRRSFWIQREYLLEAIYRAGFDLVMEQFDSLAPEIATAMLSGAYKTQNRGTFIGIKTQGNRSSLK